MAKVCISEKTALRQRWIEQGLLELMLSLRFEEITVTALCGHLGLSRRSFYRYFDDLEDVLDSLLEHTFQEFAMMDATLSVAELEESFRFWYTRGDLLRALDRSGFSGKLVAYALRHTRSAGGERRELNLFATGGLVTVLIDWHAGGFRRTPEEMARVAYDLLSKPVLP